MSYNKYNHELRIYLLGRPRNWCKFYIYTNSWCWSKTWWVSSI